MESIGARVYIDGAGEFKNDLSTMTQATKTFKSELEAINKSDIDPFSKASLSKSALTKEIEAQEQKITLLKEKLSETAEKYGENSTQAMKVTEQIEKANAALDVMKKQLDNIKNPMQIIGDGLQKSGESLEEAGRTASRVGDTISKVSLPIATGFVLSTKNAIDFESAMTGIKKTVDETDTTKYEDLEKSIMNLSGVTGITKKEIAGVMENAGQLAVGADDLDKFTKVMIDLGVSTNLSAEEASSAIAKFANIVKMPLSDVDRLGATLVDLGNNSATTEQDIMNMATRLAGAGAQIGLSEGEILGFSAALSSVGIEAEMGGSAFSKAMIKMQVAAETGYEPVLDLQEKTGMSLRELDMLSQNNSKDFRMLADSLGLTKGEMQNTITAGKNLENFAEVAGMSTEKFVDLYRRDAPAALQEFIHGLGDTEAHGETTITMLQEMGFTEVRLRDTLTRLAQSNDLVTKTVERGNTAWDENSALQIEADKRYKDHANQIAALKERISNLSIEVGERLLPYIDRFIDFADRLIAKWDGLDQGTKDLILKAGMIVAVAGPILSIGGRIISGIGTIEWGTGKLLEGIGTLVGKKGIGAVLAGMSQVAGKAGIGSVISAIGSGASGLIGAIGGIITTVGGVLATVGPVLLAITAVVAGVALVASVIAKHWDEIKEAWTKGIEHIKHGLENAGNFFKTGFENLKSLAVEGWNTIVDATHTAFEIVGHTIKSAWEGITSTTKSAIKTIGDKIKEGWESAKKLTKEAWEAMQDKVHSAWETMKSKTHETVNAIGDKIRSGWEEAKNKTHEAWESIKNKVQEAVENMRDRVHENVNNIREKFESTFNSLVDSAWNWGNNIVSNTANGLSSAWDWAVGAAQNIAGAIGNVFSNLISNAWNWGRDMIHNLVSGISGNISKVKDGIFGVANSIKNLIGFSEPKEGPLSDFHTYAPDMMQLYAQGIDDNAHVVGNALRSVGASMNDVFKALEGDGFDTGANTANNLGSGFEQNMNRIAVAANNMKQSVMSALVGFASAAHDWGADLANNMANGITSMLARVGSAAEAVGERIRSYLHFSEPDIGTLKDFHTYMPDMMKELAGGIYKNLGLVENATDALAAALLPDVDTGAIRGRGNTTSITNGNTVINVYGTENQNVNELADIVINKLTTQVRRQIYAYG